MAKELLSPSSLVRIVGGILPTKAKTLKISAYSAVMGAVTNWEAPIYLELLSAYASTIDNLNIGAALMLLLLGVGNIFTNPLSNSKKFHESL